MNQSIYNFNSVFQQLDLSALKHFYAVATFGGFSKAARATGQSQPALSLGLQKLEKSLGMQLVSRGEREFSLTKEGQAFLAFCQRMEAGLDSMVSSMGSETIVVRKRLRIGSALSLGFGPLISGCVEMVQKEQATEIELSTLRTHHLLSALQSGELDAALVPDDVYESGLNFTRIIKDHLVFVVGSSLQGLFTKLNWIDAAQKIALVTYPRETPMRAFVDRICLQNKLRFKTLVAVNTIDGITELVKAGAGGAFLLRSLVAKSLSDQTLIEVRPPFALPKSGVALAVRNDDQGDRVAKTLAKWLESW